MRANARVWLAAVAAAGGLFLLGPIPFAAAEHALSQPQLEQLAAPIALYPDELIAQILDAAQYPQQVAAASSWRSTVGAALNPDESAAALRDKPWAASVKALVDVPEVLYAMSRDLSWTSALGQAHATQGAQLLAAIQDLRRRAEAAGELRTMPQQVVEDDGQFITIFPATADAFWVPYYDPNLVYGDWPWSDYPPYFFSGLDEWGPGIAFTTLVYLGPHWHHHHLNWHRGHWHSQASSVAANAGRTGAPVALAVAPAPAAIGTPPAQRGGMAGQHAWRPNESQRGRAGPPPASIPASAPPRFPAPQTLDLPPFRMAAPTGGYAREFQDLHQSHTFSAPAMHGYSGGDSHEDGRWRR